MAKSLDDWLDCIQQRHPNTIELGLDRCRAVWTRMGAPRPARRLVTVAGTNGKGSTVAGIEAGLQCLGRRVAAYTSPHISRYNERIRIAGKEAGDEEVIAGFEAVQQALGETRLTYFEFGTLAAFATMAAAQPDVAVLEIGLGGRLDAVNLIDGDLAVITPIGLDHQDYLGADRETIGREKAGIMRARRKVVCSDRDPPLSVIAQAQEIDARLILIGEDFDVSREEQADGPGAWRYFYADSTCSLPVVMSGAHQPDNLAAALTAVLLLEPEFGPSLQELASAVAGCRVRGRLERISESPLVVVDVGHNPLAAVIVRDYLASFQGKPCRLVLGMLKDKDVESVVGILKDQVTHWYCGGLGGARGQSGAALCARVTGVSSDIMAQDHATVSGALNAALGDAGDDGLVLVFGSFQTAAEAFMHFETPN
ncbi:MAG: folylpolyglutamate synthase/dihydrofolate synthase family protein [Xanthomonadales bacterium]|nr:folylpolyglutamate synthase/dihydrofolate synthase family protein [Xanthomonadales bacterium]